MSRQFIFTTKTNKQKKKKKKKKQKKNNNMKHKIKVSYQNYLEDLLGLNDENSICDNKKILSEEL